MHFSHKAHTACFDRDIENLTSVSQNMGYFHQYNTKIVNKFFIKILLYFFLICTVLRQKAGISVYFTTLIGNIERSNYNELWYV